MARLKVLSVVESDQGGGGDPALLTAALRHLPGPLGRLTVQTVAARFAASARVVCDHLSAESASVKDLKQILFETKLNLAGMSALERWLHGLALKELVAVAEKRGVEVALV